MRMITLSLPLGGRMAKRPGRVMQDWAARWATRRALARLDAHLLDDIGLTAQEAQAETVKPFWMT